MPEFEAGMDPRQVSCGTNVRGVMTSPAWAMQGLCDLVRPDDDSFGNFLRAIWAPGATCFQTPTYSDVVPVVTCLTRTWTSKKTVVQTSSRKGQCCRRQFVPREVRSPNLLIRYDIHYMDRAGLSRRSAKGLYPHDQSQDTIAAHGCRA